VVDDLEIPSEPDDSSLKQKLENLDITLLNDESELDQGSSNIVTKKDFEASSDYSSNGNEVVKRVSLSELEPSNWICVRKQLDIGGSLGEIASHCLFSTRVDQKLFFVLDRAEDSLFDSTHSSSLAKELTDYFGETVTVEIDLGETDRETPRAADIREKSESHAAAVRALNADPAVQQFKKLFDGSLDEASVEPLD
jgi:hypothetical protein